MADNRAVFHNALDLMQLSSAVSLFLKIVFVFGLSVYFLLWSNETLSYMCEET